MLTAITAVENIINNISDKSNIWDINTEEEYHEEKTNNSSGRQAPKINSKHKS